MSDTFKPDSEIAEIAEAYTLDAIDVAAGNFRIKLDFSEESIGQVEAMLGRLHDELPNARPSADEIWTFAKIFGSYVGEVLRRQHGGQWGMVKFANQESPGFQLSNGSICWPWSRAHKRIVNGPEDNVQDYYFALVRPTNQS